MLYVVKEIFYSIQGEGLYSGMPTLFCRFSKCNLWSGHEKDRGKAICQFCDTDFVGGDSFYLNDLVAKLLLMWPHNSNPRIVLTGGEPLLQVDQRLIDELKEHNFFIAIETNGTRPMLNHIDHICVSPKNGSKLVVKEGNELKLVYPQDPTPYENLKFDHFYLQPMDGKENAVADTLKYCLNHPKWKLSLQLHKILGLP